MTLRIEAATDLRGEPADLTTVDVFDLAAGDLSLSASQIAYGGVRFVGPNTAHLTTAAGEAVDYGGSTAAIALIAGGSTTATTGSGDDALSGSAEDDWLQAGAGDDWLFGDAGDDRLFGGDGVDTAFLAGRFGDFTPEVGPDWSWLALEDASGASGMDRLTGIERVVFEDTAFALDVAPGEEAGNALALATAAFGAGAVADAALLGELIARFREGLTMDQVAQAVIDANAPPAFTVADAVTHLFATITGAVPGQAVIDFYVGLGLTHSELYVLAANSPENQAQFEAVVLAGFVHYAPDALSAMF